MNIEKLNQANELYKKIEACNEVLKYLVTNVTDDQGNITVPVSTSPVLFIEYNDEGNGRRMTEIPLEVNEDLTLMIRDFLIEERDRLQNEFNEL